MSAQASATTNNKTAIEGPQSAAEQPSANQATPLQTSDLSKPIEESQQLNDKSLEINTLANTSALSEVEALQQAILNDQSFDLSTLDASSAGPSSASSLSSETPIIDTESSDHLLSAPPVIQSTHTSFHYYSDNSSVETPETPPTNIDTIAINFTNNDLLSPTPKDLGRSSFSLTEDFSTQIIGKINSNVAFDASNQNTAYGEISYKSNGEWSYSLDNQSSEIQALAAGDTLTDTITLTSINGSTYTLELTINGTNDKALISGDKTADIQTLSNTEQSEITINNKDSVILIQTSGQITNEDRDAGESGFKADSDIQGTYGTASINTQGEWTYSLDHTLDSVISLAENKQVSDFFSVETLDGSSQLIEVSILGANDSPIFLNNENYLTLELSEASDISGDSPISDPDFNQSHFQSSDSIQGKNGYGTGTIDENGHWTYTINETSPKITELNEGDILIDYFFIATADGTQQSIIVQINGSDTPAFAQVENEKAPLLESDSEITISLNELISDSQADEELSELISMNTENSQQVSNASHFESGNSESAILQQLSQQNVDLI